MDSIKFPLAQALGQIVHLAAPKYALLQPTTRGFTKNVYNLIAASIGYLFYTFPTWDVRRFVLGFRYRAIEIVLFEILMHDL